MDAEDPIIDVDFVESSCLKPTSAAAEKLMHYHCKERALADLQMVIRDKDMPLEDQLKAVRQLAAKQCRIKQKMQRLQTYHLAN